MFCRHSLFSYAYFVAHFLACCAQIKQCHTNCVWWEKCYVRFFTLHKSIKTKLFFKPLFFPYCYYFIYVITVWRWQSLAENASLPLKPHTNSETLSANSHRIWPQCTCLVIRNVLFFSSSNSQVCLLCLRAFVPDLPSASVFPHLCLVWSYSPFPSQSRGHLFPEPPLILQLTFSTLSSSTSSFCSAYHTVE